MNASVLPNSAVSDEAQSLARTACALVRAAEGTQSLFGEKAKMLSQLRALANDCAQRGWDGAGAFAIDPAALQNAEDFVRALPEGIPLPECAPEPDGAISLDWIQSRHRLFSLSIGPSNRLAHAWLDGADRGHGVDRFDGVSVPERVLSLIKSILPA